MSFTVHETKTYEHPFADVYTATLGAVNGLEGEVVDASEESGIIQATFDKKILGKVLGDRTPCEIKVESNSPSSTSVNLEVYPLDPVGRKLMFGARKGVSQTVVTWLVAHLEHRLPQEEQP